MKQLRPMPVILAALTLCCWSAAVFACDQNKSTKNSSTTNVSASYTGKAASAAGACTAEMAAQCTPEMMAACKAKGMKAANASKMSADCCAGKASATTAMRGSAPMGKTVAVTAGAEGSCPMHATMTAGAEGSCAAHGMKTTAMTAGAEGSCAAHGMKTTAMTAGAGGSCAAHGAKNSSMAAGSSCAGKGMVSVSGHSGHDGCDACGDMDACDQTLRNMGAVVRVVQLRNGVMYVYTTDASKARAVQAALAQRNEQMAVAANSGSDAQLCPDCRQMRGAAKSGKLTREIVNIEGGCLALVTSSDPAIVAKIHSMSGVGAMARAKS